VSEDGKTAVDPETGFILDENGDAFAQMGVTIPQFCPRGHEHAVEQAQRR